MGFWHYLSKVILRIILHIFWIFPVKKDRITLLNELSFTYGDSLKYIDEYIKTKCPDEYEVIFPVCKNAGQTDATVIFVKPMSFKYFFFLLTSKTIITNAGGVSYLPLRNNQMVINTWHGGGPYKKTGVALYQNKWYMREIKMNAKNVNYFLSSCKYCTKYEAKAMLYPEEKCINSGMPRNDIFFETKPLIYKKVFNFAQIDGNKKIVLYAPTFRSDAENYTGEKKIYICDIDYRNILSSLTEHFGGEWIFAVRLHPKLKKTDIEDKNIINFTEYPDMQELLYVVNAVITDYSSLMWDYSFTKRPCFIYADDIEEYEKSIGFYMPVAKWPFPIAHSNEELIDNIRFFDSDDYIKKVQLHHEESGSYEQGRACEAVMDIIKSAQRRY
ncbi:MAG: CDP-glycerol glycerophosphotransferase family protein [Clostridiales bacterium]|nr:CDP-glycerol glycerophosphotransferase family protein [Clostridiales bacterium]